MSVSPISDVDAGDADEVLTIREAAWLLKLSQQHIRKLAEHRELPGRKFGDRWRFSRGALLRHLDSSSNENGMDPTGA